VTRLFQTRRAIEDFAKIEAFSTETWGQRVADEYLAKFETAFELIRSSPEILHARQEFSGRLLFYYVGKHWLVCDVIDDDVYVLTVKHGSMDLPARVAELEPQLVREAELLHRRITEGQP